MIRFLISFIFLFFLSCSYNSSTEHRDKRTRAISIRFDENDLQEMAKKISSKILYSSIDFSKIYSFGNIRNDTFDHMDTKKLNSKIVTILLKSKKVTIVKDSHQANAIFFGKISSIFKKNHHLKDMFFSFNLTLSDAKTADIIWSEDIEIQKIYKKKLFSW